MPMLPLSHITVKHEYSSGNWQDFTGDLAQCDVTLRELPGQHTATLVFYRANMDPAESNATTVVKKGDRVKIFMDNASSVRRKTATFKIKRVQTDIDLAKPVGRQYKVTITCHGTGITGVAGIGGSSGVGSHRELSNVVTGAKYEIDGNDFVLHKDTAWTGTAHASISTMTDDEDVVRTNLVTNPSFETNTTGWTANVGTLARTTAQAAVGTACASMTITSTQFQVTSAKAPVTTGLAYTAQALLRTAVTSRSVQVKIQFYDASNAAIGGAFAGTAVSDTTSGWTLATVTGTAPALATQASVIVQSSGTGVAGEVHYIDAVMLEKASSAGSYFDGSVEPNSGISKPTNGVVLRTNLCTNPSFETNTTGWTGTVTGWTTSTIAQDATRAHDGTQSLKVTYPASGSAAGAAFTFSGLTVGATYTASAWVFVPAGPAVRLGIPFGTQGSPSTTTGAWQRISLTFTATATSHIVGVRNDTAYTSGQTFNLDSCLCEVGSAVQDYFDGDTADPDSDVYAWTGTAHASTSTDTGAFLEVASINAATEFDQIILTRDSNPDVIGFEDPTGTLQVYDSSKFRTTVSKTWTASDYSKIDQHFDMDHIVNVVVIKYFEKIKTGQKHTRVVEHDHTYEDAASIAKYGRFKRVIKVHKKSDFSAMASRIFAKSADPQQVPRSITIPMIVASDLLPGYEDGHYVGHKVNVTLPNGTTTYTCRVSKIAHHILPDRWTVQIFLRDQNVVQRHRRGDDNFGTEVANNPDKMVLSGHLEDAIDGTGKSVTNATLQTKASGNRIVMRDDGSEGIIEFWSGASGETKGQINPQIDTGGTGAHFIDFRTSKAASPVNTAGRMQLMSSTSLSGPVLQLLNNTQLDANDILCAQINGTGAWTTTSDLTGNKVYATNPDTTTNAASCAYQGANNQIRKVTSLSRFKIDQEPLSDDAVRGVLRLTPKTWFDKSEVEANGGSTKGLRRIPGVTAEDVAEHAPEFAIYDGDELQGVAYDRIAAALIPIIRDQQQTIADLTARIEALEAR